MVRISWYGIGFNCQGLLSYGSCAHISPPIERARLRGCNIQTDIPKLILRKPLVACDRKIRIGTRDEGSRLDCLVGTANISAVQYKAR